ncbi:hypothetical protein AB1L07_25215, partial [Niallia alba]|uniref:hypothetical protein n=1 Tax=Niallia alba TaxID=2729105 RepID=UPI00399FC96D
MKTRMFENKNTTNNSKIHSPSLLGNSINNDYINIDEHSQIKNTIDNTKDFASPEPSKLSLNTIGSLLKSDIK